MDACALWRMFMPHCNMKTSRFLFTTGMVPFEKVTEADVSITQRMMSDNNVNFLRQANAFGMKLVYDLDDNVWNLPATNPSRMAFIKHRKGLENCAEWANVFTVSTYELKKAVLKEWGHVINAATKKDIPVMVVENYIDLKLFRPCTLPRNRDTVRIGWRGSNTHAGDIAVILGVLPKILADYKNIEIEFVGMWPPREIQHDPRVRMRNWCHISEYANRLSTWDWDIILAPLDDNKFNRSKSSIAMQEAGALGIPCLASDVTNYRAFAEKIPELKYLLCFVNSQWETKLRALIENAQMRKELGLAMRKNVEDNFNIEKEVWRWEEVAEAALRE